AGVCLWRRRPTGFVVAIALTAWCFLGPAAAGVTECLNHFRAPRRLVEQDGAWQRDQEIRIGCLQLEFLPSLNFYVQRNVQHYEDANEALEFLRQPCVAYLFLSRVEWERLAARAPAGWRVVGSHREMYRAGEVVVVANHMP